MTSSLERNYARSAFLVAGVGVLATTGVGADPDVVDDRNTVFDMLIEDMICNTDAAGNNTPGQPGSTPSPTAIEPGVTSLAYSPTS